MAVQTIVVGDEAALLRALKAANGETIIKLRAGGDYSKVNIDGINPSGKVTVTSLDLANRTEIDTLYVKDSSNLTFSDLYFHHVEKNNVVTGPQVRISDSHDVAFINDEFAGNVDASNTNDASGIHVSDSARISILDNRFHDLTFASYSLHSDHLILAGNDVRKVREGFDFSDVDHVLIDKNLFTEFQPVLSGKKVDHPDGIQFWTRDSTGSTEVEIVNNSFLFGNSVPIQGVFIRSERGDEARHSDFVIANNVYQGQSRHGITAYDMDGIVIRDNTVVSAPRSGSALYYDPAINTKNTTGAVIDHNISSLMFSTGDRGRSAYDNVDAYDAQTGTGISYADLFDRVPTGASGPDAFLSRDGSVADRLDAGYTHVDRTGNWAAVTDQLVDTYHGFLDNAGSIYWVG